MANVAYVVSHNGKKVRVAGPEGATPEQLKAFLDAKTDAPPAVEDTPSVPLPSEFVKPPSAGGIDIFDKSPVSAFGEGWDAARKGDRVLGLNPENRGKIAGGWFDLPASSARAVLEIGEGLYGGVKRATGQVIRNTGLSQSSPEVIADRAFELPEFALLMAPPGMFTAAPRAASAASAARTAEQARRAQLAELARRHNVDLLPADVRGPGVKALTAGSRQTAIGGTLIDNAAVRANEQMGVAARTVAGRQGRPLSAVEAGEALQRGARTFSTRSSALGGRLYDRAAAEAGNTLFYPTRAVDNIDREIARLSQSRVPGRAYPEIEELQHFRDRLTRPGGLTFEGMQQIISDAKKAGRTEALRGTDVTRILGETAQRGMQDVDIGLTVAGRHRAANAYRRANTFWRDRVETIDNALEPILGEGKSGEDALAGLQAMASGGKGGVGRLRSVLSSMPAADANNARATIIDRLGLASAGQQTAAGDAFNTSIFLTNWSKMSPEGKRALFGNNPRVAQELDDLARIAEAKKATSAYANTSGTGRAVNFSQGLKLTGEAAALLAAGHFIGVAPALAIAALDVGGGALLASPGFARILASAPRTAASAAQRQRILTNLAALAAREPGLAPYIDKVSQKISNPQSPELDYRTLGPAEPAAPNFANLSPEQLAEVMRAQADSDVMLGNPDDSSAPGGTPAPLPVEAAPDLGEE